LSTLIELFLKIFKTKLAFIPSFRPAAASWRHQLDWELAVLITASAPCFIHNPTITRQKMESPALTAEEKGYSAVLGIMIASFTIVKFLPTLH